MFSSNGIIIIWKKLNCISLVNLKIKSLLTANASSLPPYVAKPQGAVKVKKARSTINWDLCALLQKILWGLFLFGSNPNSRTAVIQKIVQHNPPTPHSNHQIIVSAAKMLWPYFGPRHKKQALFTRWLWFRWNERDGICSVQHICSAHCQITHFYCRDLLRQQIWQEKQTDGGRGDKKVVIQLCKVCDPEWNLRLYWIQFLLYICLFYIFLALNCKINGVVLHRD